MKLAIMQPYFMPYIGYFQLVKAADQYVVYDDVNYIKRGWANRNNILINGERKMFTVRLEGASQNRRFNEIEIGDDFKKLMKTLELNYSRAPHFKPTMDLMEKIVSYPQKQLSLFILNSFKEISAYLGIHTELLLSSKLNKDNSLKGQEKIINICKTLNADEYYNGIGGQELYSKEEFMNNGIKLYFLNTKEVRYRQFNMVFIPCLSIIDVLMFNSAQETNLLLDSYSLI